MIKYDDMFKGRVEDSDMHRDLVSSDFRMSVAESSIRIFYGEKLTQIFTVKIELMKRSSPFLSCTFNSISVITIYVIFHGIAVLDRRLSQSLAHGSFLPLKFRRMRGLNGGTITQQRQCDQQIVDIQR